MQREKRTGPRGIAHVRTHLAKALREVLPSNAAGSVDPHVIAVREVIRTWVSERDATQLIRTLLKAESAGAVHEMLMLGNFMDTAPNRRMLWARHLAYVHQEKAAVYVLLMIADICRDDVVSLGGCLAWRLQRLMRDGPGASIPALRRP